MTSRQSLTMEFLLLGLLALLWGSSYLFVKVAVADILPITLIALRVTGAAVFLTAIMHSRNVKMPRGARTWCMLYIQAIFNSIVSWTVLAWGQQFVDASLASVLNSTSPIFVFLLTALVTHHEILNIRKLLGALVGFAGVVLVIGIDALHGLGVQVAGQLACLFGAMLYACAAIYGKRLSHVPALATAAGTMICATVTLVPLALIVERPWAIYPSVAAVGATAVLSVFCTGVALLIYFRLVRTIGSMGVASQSYLRSGVGVILCVAILGETLSAPAAIGIAATVIGVVLINWPAHKLAQAS